MYFQFYEQFYLEIQVNIFLYESRQKIGKTWQERQEQNKVLDSVEDQEMLWEKFLLGMNISEQKHG